MPAPYLLEGTRQAARAAHPYYRDDSTFPPTQGTPVYSNSPRTQSTGVYMDSPHVQLQHPYFGAAPSAGEGGFGDQRAFHREPEQLYPSAEPYWSDQTYEGDFSFYAPEPAPAQQPFAQEGWTPATFGHQEVYHYDSQNIYDESYQLLESRSAHLQTYSPSDDVYSTRDDRYLAPTPGPSTADAPPTPAEDTHSYIYPSPVSYPSPSGSSSHETAPIAAPRRARTKPKPPSSPPEPPAPYTDEIISLGEAPNTGSETLDALCRAAGVAPPFVTGVLALVWSGAMSRVYEFGSTETLAMKDHEENELILFPPKTHRRVIDKNGFESRPWESSKSSNDWLRSQGNACVCQRFKFVQGPKHEPKHPSVIRDHISLCTARNPKDPLAVLCRLERRAEKRAKEYRLQRSQQAMLRQPHSDIIKTSTRTR